MQRQLSPTDFARRARDYRQTIPWAVITSLAMRPWPHHSRERTTMHWPLKLPVRKAPMHHSSEPTLAWSTTRQFLTLAACVAGRKALARTGRSNTLQTGLTHGHHDTLSSASNSSADRVMRDQTCVMGGSSSASESRGRFSSLPYEASRARLACACACLCACASRISHVHVHVHVHDACVCVR